jgi:hypothetical protein
MVRVLRLAAQDAWDRSAVHSEIGLVTLRQLVIHAVNHLGHHLKFIDEKKAAMGKTVAADVPAPGLPLR